MKELNLMLGLKLSLYWCFLFSFT